MEGQMRYDRFERVNFESERRKIFKLYRGTPILERREILEERVIQSLGGSTSIDRPLIFALQC